MIQLTVKDFFSHLSHLRKNKLILPVSSDTCCSRTRCFQIERNDSLIPEYFLCIGRQLWICDSFRRYHREFCYRRQARCKSDGSRYSDPAHFYACEVPRNPPTLPTRSLLLTSRITSKANRKPRRKQYSLSTIVSTRSAVTWNNLNWNWKNTGWK